MALRLTAAIPLFASIISFALSIVLLVSGSSTSYADGNYWLAINTSGVGTGIVEIKATDDDTETGALGGFINSIPGLDSILDNITNSVGDGFDDLQGQIVGSLASGLGLQEYYALYTNTLCQGNFTSTAADADVDISACYTYSQQGDGLINITNSIPSSLVVGTAEISVPLVDSLKEVLVEIAKLAVGAATAIMVFLIIGAVAQGITAIASLAGIILSENRIIMNVNLGFSTLASTAFLLLAITMSAVVAIAAGLLGGFGDGLSLHVKSGGTFMALLWVATVFSILANGYWLTVWFVEFRRSAFSRRARTEAQVGGYRQLPGELRLDLKTDGHLDARARATGADTAAAPGPLPRLKIDKSRASSSGDSSEGPGAVV